MNAARPDVDVLMITYRRPHYAALSLSRLLETCGDSVRVWLWHNGTDEATLSVARQFSSHPRVYRFHHSEKNVGLTTPTNWLWENAEGTYLSKVDDDCLLAEGWIDTLRAAHRANRRLGVVGCWRFQPEDFIPTLARKKIIALEDGHSLLRSYWVQGSGYLMKRACVQDVGLLSEGTSFTQYCRSLAERDWINGFYYPFIQEDHMDDPRSPNSALRTNADLQHFTPLGALKDNVTDIRVWEDRVRWNAFAVQSTSHDPKRLRGWRAALHRVRLRMLWRIWRHRMRTASRAAIR